MLRQLGTNTGTLSTIFVGKDQNVWDALDHGIKADAVELSDVQVTAGSAALYAPGAAFTSADIGKKIAVMGAGSSGGVLTTSNNLITAVTDGQHATMTTLATTTTVAPRTVTDAVMAIDSQTLTSATATFTAGDIGKTVVITGAGETDRAIVTDKGTIASSSTTLSASYAAFPSSLVGRSVSIAGAGASSATLFTTITAVAGDKKSCTLAAAASTSVTGFAFVQVWTVAALMTVITTYTNSTTVGLRQRATQAVSAASCSISGHSAVYGTDDLTAWQALTDSLTAGDVVTLRRGHMSLLGQGTWTLSKQVHFRFADTTSGFHYALTSGRIKAAAHGVTFRNVKWKSLAANGVCSAFATVSSSFTHCQDWKFYDCKSDGVRFNFERVGAMQDTGVLSTTGSDFDGPVTLYNPEITGVAGEGALYVFGTNDVHVYNCWVHHNGQSTTSGDQIKAAAGARGFQIHGGVSEWCARDGIDCFEAVGVVINGLATRHNQVNGLEMKWSTTQNYNAPGRHTVKMTSWNDGTGANVGTHFTDFSGRALGARTGAGVRLGAAFDTNVLADATYGMNVDNVVALGCLQSGIVVTGLKNSNLSNLQGHGNGTDGIQIYGDSLNVTNYQAFGNTTHGLELVTGSNKIALLGWSQDADGMAFINAGSTSVRQL